MVPVRPTAGSDAEDQRKRLVPAGQGYLWPWALAFMWSRMLMACLSSPSTLRKYTLLSTRFFTALQGGGA